jgi:glycosyltransferase involved in cell wall biosynthesis
MFSKCYILADGRWSGAHGIGRFSQEILSRLQNTVILTQGPSPLSIKNFYWLPYQLSKHRKKQKCIYFSPGFIPPVYSPIPFVFTIHDLIHLHSPNKLKKLFYDKIIKPAVHRAHAIITVSEYSKNEIIAWANISANKVIVIKNGISHVFTSAGEKHLPGYPYFLYVGNTKPHKNIPRLIEAFAKANMDSSIHLILVSPVTEELKKHINHFSLQNRVLFVTALTEDTLACYYRGAIALLFPSLHEGFGLPIVEAMACGTPVITSNVTSLPEIAGDAAILINPLETTSLTFHIEQIATNPTLRKHLIAKGLNQASHYSWEISAKKIQIVLNEGLQPSDFY